MSETDDEMPMPSLVSSKMAKISASLSSLEKALNSSGHGLTPGKKPTTRDILLLSEFFRRRHFGSNGYRGIDFTTKVNKIKNYLQDHFSSLDLVGFNLMNDLKMFSRVKRLLQPLNHLNLLKLNSQQKRLLSLESLESEFVFYEEV